MVKDISSSVVMSTILFPDQGPIFPDMNQQLLPAKAGMQSIKEFLFDFIADKPTTAVHTNMTAWDGLISRGSKHFPTQTS